MHGDDVAIAQPCHHRTTGQWWQWLVASLLLPATVSCHETLEPVTNDAVSVRAEPAQIDPAKAATDESLGQSHAGVPKPQSSASSQFVEQELDDLTSPFTKMRVLNLNAIVARSLSAIEAFDEARKELKADDEASVRSVLKTYAQLSEQARLARDDMQAASEQLKSSGEQYSKPIFAAMVHFVDDVDQEIRDEHESVCDRPLEHASE